MKRKVALGYIRKSLVRTASDEISPAKQRQALEHLCAMRDWTPEWYEDAEGHRSGRSEKGRPGWKVLKAQLGRSDVVAVVSYSLSRCSRDLRHFLDFLDECERHELTIATLKENVDTRSAMGRMLVNILMSFYQFEAEVSSDRMTETIDYLRRERGRHWGMIPLGCERDDDLNLVPSGEVAWMLGNGSWWKPQDGQDPPREAISRPYHAALVHCYEIYADGRMGHDRVAATLNAEGWAFRDRWGRPREWTGDDVRRVLWAWPIYAGKVTIGRAKDGVEEVIDGAHDPILDLDLIDRVVAVLEKRMGKRGVLYCGEKRANYLLGGLLYCAECGKKMQGNWQRGRATYRHRLRGDCPAEGQVDADALDRHALEVVREALKFDDEIRAAILEYVAGQITGDDDEIAALRAEMHRHEERLRNLRDLRIEGEIDRREYQEYKVRIEAEREEVIARLEDVGAIEELHRIEHVLEQVNNVFDLFGGNPAQQHLAFELLFERIEQRNGGIVGLTLRPWAQRLFLHIAPAAGRGQPPGMRGSSAPDWIRTSTPKRHRPSTCCVCLFRHRGSPGIILPTRHLSTSVRLSAEFLHFTGDVIYCGPARE